jgi:imidazolonepropionase-like amidohydrolase
MRKVLVLLVVGCASAPPPKPTPPARATLAFSGVAYFDGEYLQPPGNVIIDGDKIVAVGDVPIPAGTETVDGKGKTLLPGLIDAHARVQNAEQLEQSLAFGVTTVLDMGAPPSLLKELRDGDKPDRADLRSAGIFATAPKGYGTENGGEIPTLNGPGEAAAFVDARVAEGSDYIKIIYDDGSAYGAKVPALSRETVSALIAAAHAKNKLAVVHVATYEEARAALEAGADGLVHLFRDQAPPPGFGRTVATRGSFVVPTLIWVRNQASKVGEDPTAAALLHPDARAKLASTLPMKAKGSPDAAKAAIGQLRDANATILAGSDAPNPGAAHGVSVHEEMELMVKAGLLPARAIVAATAAPAQAFKLTDRGRIATGLRADLLLLEGDPTINITATRRIAGVWRGGVRFDSTALKQRVAAAAEAAAKMPVAQKPHLGRRRGSGQDAGGAEARRARTDQQLRRRHAGDQARARLGALDGSGHRRQVDRHDQGRGQGARHPRCGGQEQGRYVGRRHAQHRQPDLRVRRPLGQEGHHVPRPRRRQGLHGHRLRQEPGSQALGGRLQAGSHVRPVLRAVERVRRVRRQRRDLDRHRSDRDARAVHGHDRRRRAALI